MQRVRWTGSSKKRRRVLLNILSVVIYLENRDRRVFKLKALPLDLLDGWFFLHPILNDFASLLLVHKVLGSLRLLKSMNIVSFPFS